MTESLVVVTPVEALKTRLVEDIARSSSSRRFAGKGFMGVAVQVVRTEGVSALWRGAAPVVGRQATNSAVRFTAFAMIQEQASKRWPNVSGNVSTTLAMDAVSGVITLYVLHFLISTSEC